MQSVSDDDVSWKRLLEKPRFELAAKGVFRLGHNSIKKQKGIALRYNRKLWIHWLSQTTNLCIYIKSNTITISN